VSSRQWESHFGIMGWSGGTFGDGFYTDGASSGYSISTPGGHASGATTIGISGGSGALLPGSAIYFDGDELPYTVTHSVGGSSATSLTITPGLRATMPTFTAIGAKLAVGPSDQMAYLLAGHLAADEPFSLAVNGQIDRMGVEPDEDWRSLPRAYVYPAGVSQDAVALSEDNTCNVVVTLVFALTNLKPSSEGGASIASILTQIKRIAARNHQMVVQTEDGDRNLADRMTVQDYQTATLLDEKERPMAFAQSILFRYLVLCDEVEQRIFSLTH